MQDYASYLCEEARSDIAALHQFRILYNPNEKSHHFFFEGEEDSLFFMPEARRHISKGATHIYDCGGKRNVIQVRDEIKLGGYSLNSCLFFVDRDYDDFLGTQVALDDFTYITDNYSIENDLASIDAAIVMMEDILRISRADPDFLKIENLLVDAHREFHIEARTLIAWILAAKDEECSPNLRNTVGLKNIVTLTGAKPKITKKGFSEFKKKVVANNRTPSLKGILKWRRRLDLTQAKLWIRGKYDLWFFHSSLISALEEVNIQRKANGMRPISIPAIVREGKIFEILGGRIPAPPSLQVFYRNRLF